MYVQYLPYYVFILSHPIVLNQKLLHDMYI